jgi:hypothetical protein
MLPCRLEPLADEPPVLTRALTVVDTQLQQVAGPAFGDLLGGRALEGCQAVVRRCVDFGERDSRRGAEELAQNSVRPKSPRSRFGLEWRA